MPPARKAAAIILAIVGLLNWGYAGFRTLRGEALTDSLPLMIAGLVCFTLIVVFAAQNRGKRD